MTSVAGAQHALMVLMSNRAMTNEEFQKKHHRGISMLRHHEYLSGVTTHTPGGPNDKLAEWIHAEYVKRILEPANPVVHIEPTPLGTTPNALHTQVGGGHYKGKNIQPVEYIEANDLRFLEGCIIKRATRHGDKTGAGVEDLKKIIHEAQLIALLRYGVEL